MYDGSAGFDLPDAVYLGRALEEADYLWYEEPMREFSITAYKWLAERVRVPLLIAETSDGAHMNTADFIASGAASFVRTSADLRGGFTGAMRTAHLADAFRLRAEVHGPNIPNRHLCMAIQNTTYYESLVTSDPVVREARRHSGRHDPRAHPARSRAAAAPRLSARPWPAGEPRHLLDQGGHAVAGRAEAPRVRAAAARTPAAAPRVRRLPRGRSRPSAPRCHLRGRRAVAGGDALALSSASMSMP